jgi:NADH-quinone oxidoreductase subunit E
MDAVADYLDMPKISVYEVASFYSLFNLKEVGQYQLHVCTNISCMLQGSEKIVAHLKKRLGIEMGETTSDKRFTLKGVECLAACQGAPVMQCNQKYYEHLTPQKIDELLESLE